VHCEIVFLIEINVGLLICIIVVAAASPGAWERKQWLRPLTIGNGRKNVSNGRAKPVMRACASNTPTWRTFG
jgi:hypothetical protein